MTTPGSAEGAAYGATVVTGPADPRTDEERAADDLRQADETVARLTAKRDKTAQHLADAEQALADAEAARDELKGGN